MAYSKEDVQLLCKAYGVAFKRNDSKVKLSEKLTAKIRATSQIPFPGSLMGFPQQPSTPNAEQEQGTCTCHVMSRIRISCEIGLFSAGALQQICLKIIDLF